MSSGEESINFLHEHMQNVCEALGWNCELLYDHESGESDFERDVIQRIKKSQRDEERIKELEQQFERVRLAGNHYPECRYWKWEWKFSWDKSVCGCPLD